jgi:hypothetical protein
MVNIQHARRLQRVYHAQPALFAPEYKAMRLAIDNSLHQTTWANVMSDDEEDTAPIPSADSQAASFQRPIVEDPMDEDLTLEPGEDQLVNVSTRTVVPAQTQPGKISYQ